MAGYVGSERGCLTSISGYFGFAPVQDVRLAVTPQLETENSDTKLMLMTSDRKRMGGSIYMQTHLEIGDLSPDLDDLKFGNFF